MQQYLVHSHKAYIAGVGAGAVEFCGFCLGENLGGSKKH